MSTNIDTKALIAATPATVALVRRELDKSREAQRGGMTCGTPKAVKVDCAMVERLCRIAEKQADHLAELEAELARLQEDKARLEQVQSDVLANLDAPDDMDVISAAHFVAGSLSTAEEALEAAQAEARELRALVTEFANFARDSGWINVAEELERRLYSALSPAPEPAAPAPELPPGTCTNCAGTGVGGYHVHAPQEDAVEALRCEACDGFGCTPAAQETTNG